MARVLLADDDAMVRTGFRMVLEADGHETVGEADDGAEAVELARSTRPDVVVMDIRMPRIDGLQATRLLAGPDVADPLAVVVVTTFDLDENVHAALRAGARGFLLKRAGPQLLQEAVRAVLAGDAMISPSVTTRLLAHFTSTDAEHDRARSPLSEPLTSREEEVVRAVARGMSNAEVAESLMLSVSSAKAHLSAAQHKIGGRNRTEVAVWAWESGLVDQRNLR